MRFLFLFLLSEWFREESKMSRKINFVIRASHAVYLPSHPHVFFHHQTQSNEKSGRTHARPVPIKTRNYF
jgi:hypothetical protein